MRQHHALREPRRAARERQRDQMRRPDRRRDRGGRPGGASSSSNGVVPAASPIENTSSTPAASAAASARSASCGTVTRKRAPAIRSWNADLVGRVEPVDGRGRPARPRDAVERDRVLRHVRRVDPHALPAREPARHEPCGAAIDELGQFRVRQRRAAQVLDDRRPLPARRGPAQHVLGERHVRHDHVRMRAANRHGPTLRAGQCQVALAASATWPSARCDDPRHGRRPILASALAVGERRSRVVPRDGAGVGRARGRAERRALAGARVGRCGVVAERRGGRAARHRRAGRARGTRRRLRVRVRGLRGAAAGGVLVLRQGRARDRDALRARVRQRRAAARRGCRRSCAASSWARSR